MTYKGIGECRAITLTTGVDIINGTSGDDTIIGDNTGANKQLAVADQINGGAGTDTLKVYLAAADTGTGQPTLTNIENVWINGGAITAYTAATGTTGLTVENAVQALTAAGVAPSAATYTLSGQAVTLKDLVGDTTTSTSAIAGVAQTYTTTLAQAATNTATSLNLVVENVNSVSRTHTETVGSTTNTVSDTQTVDVSGARYATLNLEAVGANSALTLGNTGTALRTINVSGDKNITVTASAQVAGAVTKIDASAATGNVNVNASAAAKTGTFTFTGGSGNDTLQLRAGDLGAITSGSQLDGGSGRDTLTINDGGAALTAAQYSAINATKNFEVLGLGATGAIVDASQLTAIKSFSFGGVVAETINKLQADSSVVSVWGTTSPHPLQMEFF